VRENVTDIGQAQDILDQELYLSATGRSVKDIFCLKRYRTVDSYRRISIHNLQLRVKNAPPRERVTSVYILWRTGYVKYGSGAKETW
jgi:hypothetical protein